MNNYYAISLKIGSKYDTFRRRYIIRVVEEINLYNGVLIIKVHNINDTESYYEYFNPDDKVFLH